MEKQNPRSRGRFTKIEREARWKAESAREAARIAKEEKEEAREAKERREAEALRKAREWRKAQERKRKAKAKKKEQARKARERKEAARKSKNDSFQQIMNYLLSGDPFNSVMGEDTVKIFDRKNCVAGYEGRGGEYLKIYWNNIDPQSIRLLRKFVNGTWLRYISFSGHPHSMDFSPVSLSSLGLIKIGILPGLLKRGAWPLGAPEARSEERLGKAIRLLYSKHCTGSKRKSAF